MKSKKKILIVSALGGFIRGFVGDDIRILQSLGYEVHCAANIKGEDSDHFDDYIREYRIIMHQVDFQSTKPICRDNWKAYKQIEKIISNEKFDVIHVHTPIAGFITRMAAIKTRKKGTKVLYTTHGFNFHEKSSKKSWMVFYNLEKFVSKYTDVIITINEEDYKNAQKMKSSSVYKINGVGVNVKKYTEASVDRHKYRKSLGLNDDDFVILTMGELSKRKNQMSVLKAMNLLNNPRLMFVICGRALHEEETFEELKKYITEHNLRVKFLGFRQDIPQICKCADIGVLTSIREGLGLAGIEMIAAGIPLVTSNVHGIKDYMIDGKTGYMYAPWDYIGIADGIAKLLDNNIRKQMEKECIDMAKKFDIAISHKQRQEIYMKELA